MDGAPVEAQEASGDEGASVLAADTAASREDVLPADSDAPTYQCTQKSPQRGETTRNRIPTSQRLPAVVIYTAVGDRFHGRIPIIQAGLVVKVMNNKGALRNRCVRDTLCDRSVQSSQTSWPSNFRTPRGRRPTITRPF